MTDEMSESEIVTGWHILPDNRLLRDGRTADLLGAWQRMVGDGLPKPCKRGMHACRRLIDALQYAKGALVCRVEVRGDIVECGDKLAGRERRVLAYIDGTLILHRFAIWCAARGLKRRGVTDQRCWDALRVKGRWLRFEATDEELQAAWDAAGDAAGDAAWDAARRAVWTEQHAYLEARVLRAMERKAG